MKTLIKALADIVALICLAMALLTIAVVLSDMFSPKVTYDQIIPWKNAYFIVMGYLTLALVCGGIRSLYNEKEQ